MIRYVLSVLRFLGNIPNTKRELVLFLRVGWAATDEHDAQFIGAMVLQPASGKCICGRLTMPKGIIKKVGDLIQDKDHPEYGRALIVEVGDRRKRDPYRVLTPWSGSHWLDKNYIEWLCKVTGSSEA